MKHKGVRIPKREQWLYRDKEALKSVEKGIEQSKNGEVVKWPRFSKGK